MSRLEARDYTYFTTVRGMCRTCRGIRPARIYFQNNQVWQQSLCPTCRNKPALIAADKDWYLENVLKIFPDSSPLKASHPPRKGCPLDCGPCSWHASPCQLPVFSITNVCNLNCPICFTYNRPDPVYYMSIEELEKTLNWIVRSSGEVDLINLTGGEPTLHPGLIEIIRRCRRKEIGRITMNSNGILLAEDADLCSALAELGVYVILSFNTFDPEVSIRMHGLDLVEKKLKAIENLTRAGVKMTLLQVMMRRTNENDLAGLMDLMRANDRILSLTVQTMTYTGQGGGRWPQMDHIPVDEAVRIICERSGGQLVFSDFLPRPSAHPLCYLCCYMVKSKDSFLPFARFTEPEKIQSLMKDSYLIRLGDEEEFFKEVINNLYARGDTANLKLFREIIETLYPRDARPGVFERQRLAEASVRTVYVHSHMDESNFDCSRAMLCPDLVPSIPGRLIPACTYNLFYRLEDERFYACQSE